MSSILTVACYKADPARYKLQRVWSLLSRPARDRMGRVKDGRPCLNVSAFFGGDTHRLVFGTGAAERRESARDQSKTAPPGLLPDSSQGHGELLNELLS